jgi:hypothetical protein
MGMKPVERTLKLHSETLILKVKRDALPKRAKELLECLECQIEVCAGYEDETRKLPFKTVARGILSVLAGSLALDDTLHAQFAKAGYIASKAQIRAVEERCKR